MDFGRGTPSVLDQVLDEIDGGGVFFSVGFHASSKPRSLDPVWGRNAKNRILSQKINENNSTNLIHVLDKFLELGS